MLAKRFGPVVSSTVATTSLRSIYLVDYLQSYVIYVWQETLVNKTDFLDLSPASSEVTIHLPFQRESSVATPRRHFLLFEMSVYSCAKREPNDDISVQLSFRFVLLQEKRHS